MIVEHVLTTETVVTDLAAFRRLYPNARIVAVDGRECFGECSVCGSPVLAGDIYMEWHDGRLTCGRCRR